MLNKNSQTYFEKRVMEVEYIWHKLFFCE